MAKVRVYELAKEFGVESKAVMQKLVEMGDFVRSASSTIEAPTVLKLREEFTGQNIPGYRVTVPRIAHQVPDSTQRPIEHAQSDSSTHRYQSRATFKSLRTDDQQQQKPDELKIQILEAWEELKSLVPASNRNKSMWLANESGVSPARVRFAENTRHWIAHADGHQPHLETLRDAMRIIGDIRNGLSWRR